MSAGGKTVWGNPPEIGKVLEGSTFDVVLDNNGKDLDTVKYVVLIISCTLFLVNRDVKKFIFGFHE